MKRLISILIVFLILFSAAGCSGRVEGPDKDSPVGAASWPTVEWSTSTPEQQGLDSSILSKADKRIKENYPNVYSLLVVRHGYLVYERYYQGMGREDANPVYSVTKSVMSALTGIAIREKLIQNTGQKVSEFLPEYFTEVDDPHKKDIAIKDVLTMSGGLESIDNDYNGYFSSRDWLQYAIEQPLTEQPGTKFVYNTGLTQFLSCIITRTSKLKTADFADKFLFGPTGISVKNWDHDREGYYGGGSGIYMKPVDMAKFGYLYLNKGSWDGKQVIPEEWIAESTKKQITVDQEDDYGYLFWIETIKDKMHGKDYFTYSASGAGGQKIMVVPELDMVAVVTANIQSASRDGEDTKDIISEYVIPAATK